MDRPIRLLLLIDSLNAGGAERCVLNLARALSPARVQLHVCALGEIAGNPLRAEFERLGVPVTVLGSTRFYHPRSALRLAAIVRREAIDLIHTHLTSADLLGRTVGAIMGVPVVSTLHNELRGYDSAPPLRRALQVLTARHLAARLVPVNRASGAAFRERWRLPPAKLRPIVNGIVLEPFLAVPERPARAPGAPLTVTNIGRLHPQKGQRILLEAARTVLARRGDVRFLIVGEGGLEQELKSHARALGLDGSVVFTGLRRDIPALLGETDIFTLASLWEGLPLSAVEAMAAARPLVLTDVGGCPELVVNGPAGLVVPPGDAAALAEALLRLLDDPAARLAMGRAGRAWAREAHSMETMAHQHEALYADILAGQPNAAPISMKPQEP